MPLNNRQFKFLKNYRNVKIKSSAKLDDENVFLKGDRALSKWITLLISNKKEFNHFFKSRSSDIVLQKLGNLNQNAKRYEARNTERDDHIYRSAKRDDHQVARPRRAHSCERSELRAMRFFLLILSNYFSVQHIFWLKALVVPSKFRQIIPFSVVI